MGTCENCGHVVLDPVLGELKCLIEQHVVEQSGSCDKYTKRSGDIAYSKDNVYDYTYD